MNELVYSWSLENKHIAGRSVDFDLSLKTLTGKTRSQTSRGMKLECTRVSSRSKTRVFSPILDDYGGNRISSVTMFLTRFESLG